MSKQFCLRALLLASFALPIAACTNSPSLTSILVTPATVTATPGVTFQLTAIGSYTHPGHSPITRDITSEVTWASSSSQMVTVSSTGFSTVTGKSIGLSQISASAPGFGGDIVGYSAITVQAATEASPGAITSLVITRSHQNPLSVNEAAELKVVGKTAGGESLELNHDLSWSSSSESVVIDAHSGVATPIADGRTTITAVFKNQDGSMAIGILPLTIGSVR